MPATTSTARRHRSPAGATLAAPRLPQVQRQRRIGLAALAVVLVVGFGALAGALVLRSGDRVAVVAVVHAVPAGGQVKAGDLGIVDVAVAGIPTVPATSLTALVGRYAAVPLISGTLLSPVSLTDQPKPGPGEAVVGLQLPVGRLPMDALHSGDVLRLVLVPRDGAAAGASVLVQRATVLQSNRDAVNGGTAVSVLVPDTQATALTVASARGEVAAARVAKGTG